MSIEPSPGTGKTVFVVDDDAGIRDSLCELMLAAGKTCRAFGSGDAFLASLSGDERGCVLLDEAMPGLSGTQVLERLVERAAILPVIMITAHGDVRLAVSAMRAGAWDFLEKPWRSENLLAAIEGALRHESALHLQDQRQAEAVRRIASLTPRERQVFERLVCGETNKHIARKLDLSPRTVEFYRAKVLEKADTDNVAGLVRLAFAAGDLQP
jgi:two-component system, LuxR family, response regulator FixJ